MLEEYLIVRDWERRRREQRNDRMVRWGCAFLAVAILLVLGLVATSHGQGTTTTTVDSSTYADVMPGFWQMVERHCVAVLTEAHVEKVSRGSMGFDPPQEVDKNGNEIRHVAEQTLKLRCK